MTDSKSVDNYGLGADVIVLTKMHKCIV